VSCRSLALRPLPRLVLLLVDAVSVRGVEALLGELIRLMLFPLAAF
jgi:hypothetical protein